jgi:hypothetical protein
MRLRRAVFAGENAQRELNREMRGGAVAPDLLQKL